MAKPGPKPSPTAIKKLRGNPGNRPLNANEPDIPTDMPDCPDHLDKIGKTEWTRLAVLLDGRGLITKAERAVLTAYCETWSIHVKASKDLHTYGMILMSDKGVPYQSPYLGIVNVSTRTLMALAAELGLSPSSRSRITAAPTKKVVDPKAKYFQPRIAKTG